MSGGGEVETSVWRNRWRSSSGGPVRVRRGANIKQLRALIKEPPRPPRIRHASRANFRIELLGKRRGLRNVSEECPMPHRKWNNGPHWPELPIQPIIPFLV